jgi:hypothetical protein
VLKGVPNNLEFLRKLVEDPRFIAGDTTTKFLEDFHFSPHVMEVVLPGRWTGGTAWNPACTAELMASGVFPYKHSALSLPLVSSAQLGPLRGSTTAAELMA